MLKVFRKYPSTHSIGNGLGIIYDAMNVKQNEEINGMYSLEFDLPIDSKNRELVEDDKNWIDCEGQWYFVISQTGDINTNLIHYVYRHVRALLTVNNYISIFPVLSGTTPKECLRKALELSGDKVWFELLDNPGPKMQWMEEKFDLVDGLDNVTVYDIISNIINAVGGELYVKDNKYISIVQRIGRDSTKFWSPSYNLDTLTHTVDKSSIQNQIVVEGQDGMPLDIDKYPGSVINSEESQRLYGIRRGHLQFNDVDNKEELENKALYEISSLNPNRVDMPKITIDAQGYELDKKNPLQLGDSLKIQSKKLGISVIKRVVGIERHPYNELSNKYTIGDRALTLVELLAKLEMTRERFNKITDSEGNIKVNGIENISDRIESKNFVYNSSGEVYDNKTMKPKYWECSEGAVVDVNSQFNGSVSFKLTQNEWIMCREIPVSIHESESTSTMVSLKHKWGDIKIEIIDDEGNQVPHISQHKSEKSLETIVPYSVYYRYRPYVIFQNSDLKSIKRSYRVKITGMGTETSYIDSIMANPNFNNIIPLYQDGPNSIGVLGGEGAGGDIQGGEGGGGSGGGDKYTDNIVYSTTSTILQSTDDKESDVVSVNISKKNITSDYFNLNVQQSFVLRNPKDEIEIGIDIEGQNQYRVKKKYEGQSSDILTFCNTLSLPISIIGDVTGARVTSKIKGSCNVMPLTTLNCMLAKNTSQYKVLLTVDMGYESPENSKGKIYEDERGRVKMEIWAVKKGRLNSLSAIFKTTEQKAIFNRVQEVKFIRNADAYFTGIVGALFSSHPNLEIINGLDSWSSVEDSSYVTLQDCFKNCPKLFKVSSFPKNVESYRYCFANCQNLTEVPMIEGLKTSTRTVSLIGMFLNCTSLEEISIGISSDIYPGKTNAIDEFCMGCIKLRKISGVIIGSSFDGNLSTSAKNAFKDCKMLNGTLRMDGKWGTPDSQGKDYSTKVAGCFEGCSIDENTSLLLTAESVSKEILLKTKSPESNIS